MKVVEQLSLAEVDDMFPDGDFLKSHTPSSECDDDSPAAAVAVKAALDAMDNL